VLDQYVEQILTASNRAANLVKKILSFSRKQVQQRERTVLAEVFSEAVGLLRATLPATIELEQELDATLPPVFADPTQLLQVIMNLCTNATHAMNNRGKIRLRVDSCTFSSGCALPSPELKPGRYARLTVIDTGHGMGPATIERIFDPFFTTKKQGTGTGLGLAVVFGIVKDHGGVITVESELDKGTTFTVYLPLMDAEVAVEVTGKATPGYGHGELVMFVDDEQTICDAGRELLARAGYRCEICQSSNDAWTALEKDPGRYAAVVTDLTMPGLTGLELAARISKLRTPLPVVLTTGFLDSDAAQAIVRLQIQQVVSKPYSYGALTIAVASAIESRRA
jgi:CheY-like chemotaxis protein